MKIKACFSTRTPSFLSLRQYTSELMLTAFEKATLETEPAGEEDAWEDTIAQRADNEVGRCRLTSC